MKSENSRLNKELQSIKSDQTGISCDIETHNIIDQLRTDLNDKDQLSLLNDLEINGVPEYRDESSVHIIRTLAMKIGVTLGDRDVVSSKRMGPVSGSGGTANAQPRARPLVVRLATRTLHDELLQSARARN